MYLNISHPTSFLDNKSVFLTCLFVNFLQARIDSHNKILYARHADQRNATFQRALQTGSELERDVKAMLLRANLMKHDFNQRSGSGQRKM
jgi:COP9 signalosome complex subunit 1